MENGQQEQSNGKSVKPRKACKNAYFYFVMSQKEKRETKGHRIYGTFDELSQRLGGPWASMTKEERAPYEAMEKEAKLNEKEDLNNKFIINGETFAKVEMKEQEMRDDFIKQLVSGPGSGERMIILMKMVHSVEELLEGQKKQYWPSELGLVVFNLAEGVQTIYSQLIDTMRIPTGYASQAKENCEENMLPLPGDTKGFDNHCRDYLQILRKVNGFANYWLDDGYKCLNHQKVFFALDSEIEPLISCLKWLVNALPEGEDKNKYACVMENLKVYSLTQLIVNLATAANEVNPAYNNLLVKSKLDSTAEEIISNGKYDYCNKLACDHHYTSPANLKMHNCATSVVMRRAYLMFEEFVPAFKYTFCMRHKIDELRKSREAVDLGKKQEESPKEEDASKVEETELREENNVSKEEESEVTEESESCSGCCSV